MQTNSRNWHFSDRFVMDGRTTDRGACIYRSLVTSIGSASLPEASDFWKDSNDHLLADHYSIGLRNWSSIFRDDTYLIGDKLLYQRMLGHEETNLFQRNSRSVYLEMVTLCGLTFSREASIIYLDISSSLSIRVFENVLSRSWSQEKISAIFFFVGNEGW